MNVDFDEIERFCQIHNFKNCDERPYFRQYLWIYLIDRNKDKYNSLLNRLESIDNYSNFISCTFGENETNNQWVMLIDKKTGELWFELFY